MKSLNKCTAAIVLVVGIAFNYAACTDSNWIYLLFGVPLNVVWLYLWCALVRSVRTAGPFGTLNVPGVGSRAGVS